MPLTPTPSLLQAHDLKRSYKVVKPEDCAQRPEVQEMVSKVQALHLKVSVG